MASFSIPLTGLEADTTNLNTIANNLSNMNTTAFKSQQTSFEDLLYQQVGTSGSNDPILAGQGVKVAANSTNFTQGSVSTTGVSSDVALTGNGFFVVNNGGTSEYTRAGNFQTDQNGNLITTNGQQVMGYPAANGVVSTNAPLTGIHIPVGATEQPQATSQFALNLNLNSNSPIGTVVPAQITVYDSLGNSHILSVNFTKTGTNNWYYATNLPPGDYGPGRETGNQGTLTFNSNGQLDELTYLGPPVWTSSSTAPPVMNLTYSGLTDGAADMSLAWDFSNTNGDILVTQVASSSTVSSTTQNGYASGNYQDFSIGSDGTVSVQFSNGQTQSVGQLAVASVNNLEGLQQVGGNNYVTTLASGQATVGVAGTGGRGTIDGGSLEQSNVNISTEFSNLIVAQSAYQANAKSITTFDTIEQTAINMIPQA